MTQMTAKQEDLLAIFKANLHLPNGGFHALIVELACEYQLPFHTVKPVLKQSQKIIEKKIKTDVSNIIDYDLTQDNWLSIIKHSLEELAQNNRPLMDVLIQSQPYMNALHAIEKPIMNESEREEILENLALAYEQQVYKPLMAMLYTSKLYWRISDDLYQMTLEKQQEFSHYSHHMAATQHLLNLSEKVKAKTI